MHTRCPTCLRTERHLDGQVEVLVVGGQRQPEPPQWLAEWRVLRESLDAGIGVAGPCGACGMPMLADGAAESWTLALPDGEVILEAGVLRAAGEEITVDAVEARVQAASPKPSLAETLYHTAMFSWLIVPVILWFVAFSCFSAFLCIGVPQGAEFMPR